MAEIVVKLVNGELAGKTAQSIAKEVNAAALALKKAEVGTKAWVDANAKLEGAKQLQADYKAQVDATTKASNNLKSSFGGILNQIPGFGALSGILSQARGGVGGLTSGFGLLKGAIAATGIGLLVIAFTTLVQWFKKTDEGATLLSGIFKGLGIVVDKVFGGMINIFKNIAGYFTGEKSIKQGLIDLVEFIGNNLLNRLKAFAVVWDGIVNLDFKKVADGFIQMGTGITDATSKMAAFGNEIGNAVKEGIDLEKQLDGIQDRARGLSVLNAQTDKAVSQLLLQSKNVGLSFKERIALLDQAGELELHNHEQALANALELEAFQKAEVERNKKNNIQNDDLDQAYADAQIKRINLEKASIDLREKIANRRTALTEKESAEVQKAADEEAKQIKKIEDLRVQAIKDAETREIAETELKYKRELEAITLQGDKKIEAEKLLEEVKVQEIKAIKEKYAQEEADFALAEFEKKMAAATTKYQKEQKALEDHLEEVKKMEKAAAEAIPAAVGKLATTIAESYISTSNIAIQQAQRRVEAIKESYGEESLAYQNANAQYNALRKEQGEKMKKAQRAEVIINAVVEASNIWKESSKFGPAGLALAIIQTAALGIRTLTALKTIKGQQFYGGGYTGDGGKYEPAGVVHAGEVVWSQEDVKRFGGVRAVEAIRPTALNGYVTGGPVSPFENRSRPALSRSSAAAQADPFAAISDLKNTFITYANAMDKRMDRIQVNNNVQDTEKGIKVLNRLRNEADV